MLPTEKIFPSENLRKDQNQAVALVPEGNQWKPMLDSLKLFTDDFMADRNQLPIQLRECF